jgi:hypothetical protein
MMSGALWKSSMKQKCEAMGTNLFIVSLWIDISTRISEYSILIRNTK